jgi:hypothetical protein
MGEFSFKLTYSDTTDSVAVIGQSDNGPCLRSISDSSCDAQDNYPYHVLLQNEQKENPQDWHVRSLDQPDSSSTGLCGLGTAAWQN